MRLCFLPNQPVPPAVRRNGFNPSPALFWASPASFMCGCASFSPTETGELYHQQTAVYPSVEAYNERSAVPYYQQLADVLDDFQKPVTIDLQTLTIDDLPAASEAYDGRPVGNGIQSAQG